MLIHRDALVVHEVTTPETMRYFLNGALIDKKGRTVATDGHLLVRFTGMKAADDTDGFPAIDGIEDVTAAADVIVSRDDLRAALATAGKKTNMGERLAIVPNGTHVTIATATEGRSVQITSRKIEGTFPDYEKVMRSKEKPVIATVILNAEYLETLGRMVRQSGGRAITMTLHGETAGVMEPVFFTVNCDNGVIDGALMPMRP